MKFGSAKCSGCGHTFRAAWSNSKYCSTLCTLLANSKLTPSGCREWQASLLKTGYGNVRVNKKTHRVHRLMWEITYGEIPSGLVVRHSCDNRKCLNPNHLSLGTTADNNRDARERLRIAKGAALPHTKLTETNVVDILQRLDAGETCAAIAAMYGVHRVTINQIRTGKSWSHVTGRKR